MHAEANRPDVHAGQAQLSDAALDRATRTLVPHLPDELRCVLRAPLRRWHAGTVNFLRDRGEFTLREFACSWMLLAALYPADQQKWICFMTCSLFQILDLMELELELLMKPPSPQRDSDALRMLTTKLFGPDPASVFTPLYAEKHPGTRH